MLQWERSGSWKLGLTRAFHQAARHQTWVCQDGTGLAGFCDATTSRATRWESEHGDSCVFVRKDFGVQVIEVGMADSSSVPEQDATRRLVAAVKLLMSIGRNQHQSAVDWCTTIRSFSFGLTSHRLVPSTSVDLPWGLDFGVARVAVHRPPIVDHMEILDAIFLPSSAVHYPPGIDRVSTKTTSQAPAGHGKRNFPGPEEKAWTIMTDLIFRPSLPKRLRGPTPSYR